MSITHRGHEPSMCPHPEIDVYLDRSWSRLQWEGWCKRCGTRIIRTDEAIARGEVPAPSAVDRFIAGCL